MRMVSDAAEKSRALLLMMVCSVVDLVDYLLVRRIGLRSWEIDVHTHKILTPHFVVVLVEP